MNRRVESQLRPDEKNKRWNRYSKPAGLVFSALTFYLHRFPRSIGEYENGGDFKCRIGSACRSQNDHRNRNFADIAAGIPTAEYHMKGVGVNAAHLFRVEISDGARSAIVCYCAGGRAMKRWRVLWEGTLIIYGERPSVPTDRSTH